MTFSNFSPSFIYAENHESEDWTILLGVAKFTSIGDGDEAFT